LSDAGVGEGVGEGETLGVGVGDGVVVGEGVGVGDGSAYTVTDALPVFVTYRLLFLSTAKPFGALSPVLVPAILNSETLPAVLNTSTELVKN
jgi:hypothetical protein